MWIYTHPCIHMRVLHRFCCACCLPSPHTPIHKGFHKGAGRPKATRPLCGGGRRPPPLMDGCVGAGKASDVAKSCPIMQESWQLNGTLLDGTLPCRAGYLLAEYHVASLDFKGPYRSEGGNPQHPKKRILMLYGRWGPLVGRKILLRGVGTFRQPGE